MVGSSRNISRFPHLFTGFGIGFVHWPAASAFGHK